MRHHRMGCTGQVTRGDQAGGRGSDSRGNVSRIPLPGRGQPGPTGEWFLTLTEREREREREQTLWEMLGETVSGVTP